MKVYIELFTYKGCKMNEPSSTIYVDGKRISHSDPVYFIAEIGSNFDQSLDRAKELIFLAKEAGANAVKFQHYTASTLVSDIGFKTLSDIESHQSKWKKSVAETYDEASLNKEWTQNLENECKKIGVTFFSSPYSLDLVDYIDPYVPAYKIGSGDITWTEIIKHIAKKKKPTLIATGASKMSEVRHAVDTALSLNPDVILMQCNTNYTINKENFRHIHLNVLKSYAELYPGIILGLSDHTPGHVTTLGAVSLGVKVIEKHFTDSNEREGPDHNFAMTPSSWRNMVDRTRELEMSLGETIKKVEENEKHTIVLQRRCIRASRTLQAGYSLTLKDMDVLRPCPPGSIPANKIETLVGKILKRKIEAGEHFMTKDFE